MNGWLLFLLKSAVTLCVLYLFFRLLMSKETSFKASRSLIICIAVASVIIPVISIPHQLRPPLQLSLEPVFPVEEAAQTGLAVEITAAAGSPAPVHNDTKPVIISYVDLLFLIYLTGVFISLVLFIYGIASVFLLMGKSRKADLKGIRLMILSSDLPAFSFGRRIMISQTDYENNSAPIITHELSHIRQGHFYDLMLMELLKIVYWFNPVVYRLNHDLKEIHEFQADKCTIGSGVDSTEYQLLIIQKCVGHQSFALANSFNHCQIKKRIAMMNKSQTSKAWRWKVATFLPVLALLLMAFGKRAETVPGSNTLPAVVIKPPVIIQKPDDLTNQVIEIRKDGNYIDNKICSLDEIAMKNKEWISASNKWILLLADESIPLKRIDEVRKALNHDYWIVQRTVNSDDYIYFAGDVSKAAKLKEAKFGDWFQSQVSKYPEIMSFVKSYGKESVEIVPAKNNNPAAKVKFRRLSIQFSFIIDQNGKVRDAHIIQSSGYPEVDAAYQKILDQIPDWEPAKRGKNNVSVYNHIGNSPTYSEILEVLK